jgi:hypothetical protein
METKEHEVAERLEAAATLLERTLTLLEERQTALSGQVERISATVEQTRREEELAEKLAAAEREIAELKAEQGSSQQARAVAATKPAAVENPLRRTVPASTTEMLAKHGIGDGPVDVKTLDAALGGLSLEQRIAVKSQLHRAGAI